MAGAGGDGAPAVRSAGFAEIVAYAGRIAKMMKTLQARAQ
jgi:hypothetical protein